MNKLVIIGNGFDLAHKELKTSYSDFILWHINKVFYQYGQKKESNLIKIDSNLQYSEISTIDDLKRYKGFNDSNLWFKLKGNHLFIDRILKSIDETNWVDIERAYYLYLLSIQKNSSGKVLEDVEILNNIMDVLKSELKTYISEQLEKNITEELEIKEHFNDILETTDFDNSRYPFMILDFNYTNIIEKYFKNIHVNYIHGELNNLENPIIFGYGDETDDNYAEIEKLNRNVFLKHMKSFAYLQTPNYRKLFNFLDTGSFDVHIMGHSLGLSDRLLFTHIFEHRNFNSVKIYYYEYLDKEQKVVENDYFEKTQNLSRYFRLDSKHKMRTKVVPFNESKPLTPYKPQN